MKCTDFKLFHCSPLFNFKSNHLYFFSRIDISLYRYGVLNILYFIFFCIMLLIHYLKGIKRINVHQLPISC